MNPTAKPDWRVWQDARVAERFTDVRRGGVYGAPEQFATMLRLMREVPAAADAPAVLDLGCGDGALLEVVFDAFPAARGVGVDGSPAMLDRARARFAGGPDAGRVQFLSADFSQSGWVDGLPTREFDAIVSGFAIHHIEDDRKRALYGQVFGLLRPGGVFVNVEHVASAGLLGAQLFEEHFANHMATFLASRDQPDATPAQVLAEMRAAADRDANRLSPVEAQLAWLRGAGFVEVDCYWKWYELAVLAGFKPRDASTWRGAGAWPPI